ncbi:MAG: T9SS type A sorting domain-containing protein, partial [Bacteroidota bacterium]
AKQDPNLIYANDTTAQRRVHRSTDGGATWTAIPTAGFFGEIRIHPTNSQIIFYTGFTSIMRSTNGLVSATAVYTDTGLTAGQQIMDIKISQSNPNVVWACAKGYYLYRSTNGGDTFTKITAMRDSVYNNPVSVEEDGSTRSPLSFALLPNWPNPFNPTTRIRFSIPDVEARLTVSLRVFDVLGREVATLVNKIKLPGEYSVQWNAEGFASGIYFYKLQAGAFIATKKMLLVR